MQSYRVPEHVISANLTAESVLLNMDSREYYQLNETGQHIWKLIEAGADGDRIVADLVATFDVDPERAAAEYTRITDELASSALLEPAG